MALNIEWTSEAEEQLDNIIKYLEANFTDKEIRDFFSKLETGIEIISRKPLQQKRSTRKTETHEYQVSPQTTLFYSFDNTTATILVLWSNRMNPDKLK
ncbi:MAG: hypothetical protein COA97_12915 [Flavobacteriales bacterium]|nr:MAG: hypothetical protein COA97_12915 [Flavobacteriales bacterium]